MNKKPLNPIDFLIFSLSLVYVIVFALLAYTYNRNWNTTFGNSFLFIIGATFIYPILLWIYRKKSGLIIGTLAVEFLILISCFFIYTGNLPLYCSGGDCGYDEEYFIYSLLGIFNFLILICETFIISIFTVTSRVSKIKK